MKAKLVPPNGDKSWSLQFFEVPIENQDLINSPTRASIWYWSRHYGDHFHVSPFLQGNTEDWIMVEFWSKAESYILEACEQICKELQIELEM